VEKTMKKGIIIKRVAEDALPRWANINEETCVKLTGKFYDEFGI